MVALTLNTSFTDRVNDNNPAVVQRLPMNLSANRSFTQPTSFTLPFNRTGSNVNGMPDDVVEPLESRVARNIFRTGLLDEATRRALLTDSHSLSHLNNRVIGSEKEKKEDKNYRFLTRLLLQSMLRASSYDLPPITKTEYISIASFLAFNREEIIGKIKDLVQQIKEADIEIGEAEVEFAKVKVQVQETEADFYLAKVERNRALEEVERNEEDVDVALEELETRKNELDRAEEVVATAEAGLARDTEGRILRFGEDGLIHGVNEDGSIHEYAYFRRQYLKLRINLMQETTADQFDACQNGLCQIREEVEEAHETLQDRAERLEEARDRLIQLDTKYNGVQVFLNDLRSELYQLEDTILAMKLERENKSYVLDLLTEKKDRLDNYIENVFSNEDTMKALANGDMSIQQLVDQMPPFVRHQYDDSLETDVATSVLEDLEVDPDADLSIDQAGSPFRKIQLN